MRSNITLVDRTMVNLSSFKYPNLLGHIEIYEVNSSGNLIYKYYIERRFYAAKEVDQYTGKIIEEESSNNDYHYCVDIFFNDRTRWLGWNNAKGTYYSD